LMYVNQAKSRAVMFNYQVANRYKTGSTSPVKLKGLQPDKRYAVKEVNLYPGTQSTLPKEAVYTGEFLMTIGFNPDVNTSRTSVILEITEA
jgi:alpha-galactosidase